MLVGGGSADGTPTDEILLMDAFSEVGTLTGVVDAGSAAVAWTGLHPDADIAASTSIAYAVRAAEDAATFASSPTGWTDVVDGIPAGVPRGRYLQWRATLQTADVTVSPTLRRIEFVAAF